MSKDHALKLIDDALMSTEEIHSALKRLAHSVRHQEYLDNKNALNIGIKNLTDVVFDPMFIEMAYIHDRPDRIKYKDDIEQISTYAIENLMISPQLIKILKKQNIFTVGQLVGLTELDLLKIPKITKDSFHKIKDALFYKHLRLGMQIED